VPLLDSVNRRLDLVNMVNYVLYMYICLSMSPSVSHPRPVFRSSVPRSKPLVRPSPPLVHQHDTTLLDLLHSHRSSLCSTPAHHKQRDMLHNTTLTLRLVGIPRPVVVVEAMTCHDLGQDMILMLFFCIYITICFATPT
jgi:hypothetical protein